MLRDGFTLMADMLEAAGLTEQLTTGTVTVFAVPDSVLEEVVPGWTKGLADEKLKAATAAAIASHGIDESLSRGWFAASNGQVWTLAGNYASGAKPISFHDLGAAGLTDRKSTRLNSSHQCASLMPSSALKKK